MVLRISPDDEPLVIAFLEREAKEYRWQDPENGPKNYVIRRLKELYEAMNNYKCADFVVLESLTNLGCTQRELRLSGVPWESGVNIGFNFGNSPTNGIGHYKLEKR